MCDWWISSGLLWESVCRSTWNEDGEEDIETIYILLYRIQYFRRFIKRIFENFVAFSKNTPILKFVFSHSPFMLRMFLIVFICILFYFSAGAYVLEFSYDNGEKKYYMYDGYEMWTKDGVNFYNIPQYDECECTNEEEIIFSIEDGKYYDMWWKYVWEFNGTQFIDTNGDTLYTFDGKNYYNGSEQTESTRIFTTDEWEVSTLGKQKEIEDNIRNSVYSRSFLFDFYDSWETHPKYGKKYYTDFEPLYSKDGENFYNAYGEKIATKKDGVYTFFWAGDYYQFDGKNFTHATQKMPYSWDGKEYYKFGKKLIFTTIWYITTNHLFVHWCIWTRHLKKDYGMEIKLVSIPEWLTFRVMSPYSVSKKPSKYTWMDFKKMTLKTDIPKKTRIFQKRMYF